MAHRALPNPACSLLGYANHMYQPKGTHRVKRGSLNSLRQEVDQKHPCSPFASPDLKSDWTLNHARILIFLWGFMSRACQATEALFR